MTTIISNQSPKFPTFDGTGPSRTDVTLLADADGYDYNQLAVELMRHQELLKNKVYSLSAVVTPGGSNVCDIAISALDSEGALLAGVHNFDVWLSDDAAGAGLTSHTASGAVGVKSASGELIGTLTTKKALSVQTLATGIFTLEITDTGKNHFVVCAKCPGTGLTVVLATLSDASYG